MMIKKFSNNRGGFQPRRLRKFIIPILLLVLCVFSLLAGCQFQDILSQTIGPTAFSAPTKTVENQAAAAPTASLEPSVVVTRLVIWLPPQLDPNNGSAAGEILKNRLAGFQKEHPQYIVEVRIKAVEGKNGMLDSLSSATAVAPAALPALVALPYPVMGSAVESGLLQPFSDETVNLKDTDWLPYAAEVAKVNDEVYGFPFGGDLLVLAYRPQQAPLPPVAWMDLVNQGGMAVFPAADPGATVPTLLYLSAGGSLKDKDGAPTLEREPLQKAFEVLNGGAQRDVFPYWSASLVTFDQSWNSFIEQQTDYALTWSSIYLATMPENVAITTTPSFSENPVTLVKGWSWCMPMSSQGEKQDRLILAEYLSEPAFVNQWARAAGYFPVRTSGLETWRDQLDPKLLAQLSGQDLLIPFAAPNRVTTPILSNASLQIVKKQVNYLELLDSTLSQFQVK